MRVLISVPAIGSIYGGISKIVCELAYALANQGTLVDLITTNINGKEKLDVPLNTWLSKGQYRLQYFDCIHWNDYKWSNSLIRWIYYNISGYDIAHNHAIFSLTNLPLYFFCINQHIPYVISPHGMLEPWALAYKAVKKKLYFSIFEKPALNQASAIHATATPEAKTIRELTLKPPIVTIPNGIHPQDFVTPADPNLFYQHFPHTQGKTLILFLGRIDPKKGLDLLAPAFAQVQAHHPNTHLIIAGPDNIGFLPTAQQYFQTAHCAKAVTFTGLLSGPLKAAALAAATLYIAPSYSEGFSMSVLEAMASGLPCIITTGCNFPEATNAQAAHVVPIAADALAQAMLRCLADLPTAKAMGDRARQFILANYTWDRIATQLIEVYTAILDEQPIPYQFSS